MRISKNIFVIILIETVFVLFLFFTNDLFLSIGASVLFLMFSLLFFIKYNPFKGIRIPISSFKVEKGLRGIVSAIIFFIVFLMLGELAMAFVVSFFALYFHKSVKSSFSYVVSSFFLGFSIVVLVFQVPIVGEVIHFVYLFLLIGLLLQFIERCILAREAQDFSIPNFLAR